MSKTTVPSKKRCCGICGATRKLMKSECCDNWICNDEFKYKESCSRAHRRESICGYHHTESHPGKWQDCTACKEEEVGDEYPIDESKYEKPPPKPRKRKATSDPKVPLKKKACGLCGKTRNLTTTDCCDNWICNDEHKYRLFSYALNSCSRNHNRYSTCAFHHNEGHTGKWQDCNMCKKYGFEDDGEFPIEERLYERKPRQPKAKKAKTVLTEENV